MASPSCSSAPDVFLSYRGEDTRKTFTSHLHAALVDNGINTNRDFELERGEEIAPALLKSIEDSKLSVVIFSQNYASSTWCLDELAHILECKQRHQQLVIPIFYGVDPSHVRYQRESFAAAFVQHEQHFKDTPDKVLKWRDALTKASNLAGFDSRDVGDDSKLVKVVVQDILTKLCECSIELKKQTVCESYIELCIAPPDVQISSWLFLEGEELDRSVAEDECFRCGRQGHWAKDCPLSGDHDKYGMQMGRGSSSGWSKYGVGDRSSVGRNECFKCGHPGHWARDCSYAADQEMQGRGQAGASSGWSKYGVGDRSSVGRNECFKCGHPGHWARDCSYAADQEMQGRGQAGGDDSNNDYIVYSFGGRRSLYWEDVCFKCGLRGHWQQDCPSENGGGESDDDSN